MLRHPPDLPYLHRTNSLGMRSDREYPEKQRPGCHRIVLLGDSYTAGHGVINNARFSDVLEASYPNLDVMNFGLSGSGTDQQVLIYETLARPFGADAFILAPYVWNIERNVVDIFQAGWRRPDGTGDVFLRPKPYFTLDNGILVLNNEPVPKGINNENEATGEISGLSGRSGRNVQRLLPSWVRRNSTAKAISRVISGRHRENSHTEYDSENNPPWLLMRAIIERFCREVREKPTIIVPLPSFSHFGEDVPPTYMERFRNLHALEENRVVVDVLPYFKKLSREERMRCVFKSDIHYSPLGHKLVAEAISDALAEHYPMILDREH